MPFHRFPPVLCAALSLVTTALAAEPAQPQASPGAGPVATLSEVRVTAAAPSPTPQSEVPFDLSTPPIVGRYQLPQTSESITAPAIQKTVNIVDTEDAVKYFPSLFLRKRNYGDTQAVLATRTWGLNSSARSLVYADDILISALIANNNTIGAPRWGLVSPDEIERIDFLYGPFAAAYPGNSMGGVMKITTKMPEKFTIGATETEAFQTFGLYATKGTYVTDQINFLIGDRNGNVSWLVAENFQNGFSQPLAFITNATMPANTTGAFRAVNKIGAQADVVGAGGLLHSQMNNLSGKVAWDITPALKLTYQTDLWMNNTTSTVQTYLHGPGGGATFAGLSGFANNNFALEEKHLANSISLKTDTGDFFDWDLSASNYYYLQDNQWNPFGVAPTGTRFTRNGTITQLAGTNWTNGDIRGILRPGSLGGPHEISFGLHLDNYNLNNPVYGTSNWTNGSSTGSALYTDSRGSTMTEAAWIQDAWTFLPNFKLTAGGRMEVWEAFNGYNMATKQNSAGSITSTTAQNQPDQNATRFSPKVALSWTPSSEWEVTASFGQAYRFPTVTELYQIISTGPTFSIPNPNLKPEDDISEEIAIQRKFTDGTVRISIFNENVYDALIQQTAFLGTGQTPVNFIGNVTAIRETGIELAGEKDNFPMRGVDLFGSFTCVNSEILSDSSFVSTTGNSAIGKQVPYVPAYRVTFGITVHPTSHLSFTTAVRYSSKMYSNLDNSDGVPGVFGAFDSFVVLDIHARYKFNDWLSVDAGIDNLNNDKYFLYHPFPQRTFTMQVKCLF